MNWRATLSAWGDLLFSKEADSGQDAPAKFLTVSEAGRMGAEVRRLTAREKYDDFHARLRAETFPQHQES